MKNLFYFIPFCFFLLCIGILSSEEKQEKPLSYVVLVSVSPHKFFIEKIAKDTVKVYLMVPAGASSHTYEPSPKQLLASSVADVWFQLGEPFEIKASNALTSYHPQMKIVSMQEGLDLIRAGCGCHQHKGHCHDVDLHYWLSPQLAKIQAKTIAENLSVLYPENRDLYQKNLQSFVQELDELDQFVRKTMEKKKNPLIMVSHPAYGYFCRDYGCEQLSIEFEGKDPTPQQLTKVLQRARQAKIRTIFIQMQYNSKGARLIADQIGAKIVTLDPYAENYFRSIREIAEHFAQSQ